MTNKRDSPRLQFSKEELENPKLARKAEKAEQAAERYDHARKKLQTHRPVSYTHLDVYKRQGLGICGVINLLEGYGNDNPGAKSQGIKQLMAGGGVALIGTTLVPLLSGLFG